MPRCDFLFYNFNVFQISNFDEILFTPRLYKTLRTLEWVQVFFTSFDDLDFFDFS